MYSLILEVQIGKKEQNTTEVTYMGNIIVVTKFMAGQDKVTSERLHKNLKASNKTGYIAWHLRTYEDVAQILDP